MKVLYFMVLLFAVSACSSDKEEKSSVKENTTSITKATSTDKHGEHDDDHNHSGTHDDHATEKKAEKANPYDGIIYIETGSVQCQAQGVTHLETAQLLIDNGIEVIESQCADLSGEGVVIQCGLVGPDINVHTVAPENHARSLAMGFKSTSSLKQGDDIGYTIKDCDSLQQQ